MTPGAALVLLGFGIGAFALAAKSATKEEQGRTLQERADALRAQTSRAQEAAARAARHASELLAQWNEIERAARRVER